MDSIFSDVRTTPAHFGNTSIALWTVLIGGLVVAAFTAFLSCANSSGSDDAADANADDDDSSSCDLNESSMVEIPFSSDGSDCGALGLAIVVDHLFADASLRSFKITGQFSIDNDNVYYLRTPGLFSEDACFTQIENSGTFEIGANYLECTMNLQVDVVASTAPDSSSFCSFWVQSGIDCENGDDDSDDDNDDDDSDDDNDDDTSADCVETLGDNVETCFEGITAEDVCSGNDAECWLDCFDQAETCGDWLECLEADCDYGGDDDSDDDSGGTPPVLGDGLWNPDPAADDGSGAIVSVLQWTVCDVDDDLSGGQIFVWLTGTQTAALAGDVFWDDFTDGAPSAPDCGAPVDVGVGVDFSALVPFGDDICVDVEATDGEGNMSNLLEYICVFVP